MSDVKLKDLKLKPEVKSKLVSFKITVDEWDKLLLMSKGNVSQFVRYKLFGEKTLKDIYGE